MKFNKKTTVSLFLAGCMLFSGAALADILMGSGYSGAKQSLKETAEFISDEADSLTLTLTYDMKFDGKTLLSCEEIHKNDIKNSKRLDITTESTAEVASPKNNVKTEYYYDLEKIISRDSEDDVYHQTNLNKGDSIQSTKLTNPFEEEYADDIEKIVDAFVGGMKDFVQTKEESGGKLYYGSLDASQMTTLASTLSSFAIKYGFMTSYFSARYNIPEISEVYVSGASAKAFENSDGILENIVADMTAVATDKDGVEHSFEMSLTSSISDINSTVVTEPATNGKVEITEASYSYENYLGSKAVGVYKNSMATEKDGKYVKVGERTITINSVDGETVKGHFTWQDISGEMYVDCDITANYLETFGRYVFDYTCKNGEKKIGVLYPTYLQNSQDVMIELDVLITNNETSYYQQSDDDFIAIRQFD